MIVGTCHSRSDSYRIWRKERISRGVDDMAVHSMYSRNHCFVIMPNSAEARLRTRLRNHKLLIQTAGGVTENDGAGEAGGRELFAI